jgi:hypothetical protein
LSARGPDDLRLQANLPERSDQRLLKIRRKKEEKLSGKAF